MARVGFGTSAGALGLVVLLALRRKSVHRRPCDQAGLCDRRLPHAHRPSHARSERQSAGGRRLTGGPSHRSPKRVVREGRPGQIPRWPFGISAGSGLVWASCRIVSRPFRGERGGERLPSPGDLTGRARACAGLSHIERVASRPRHQYVFVFRNQTHISNSVSDDKARLSNRRLLRRRGTLAQSAEHRAFTPRDEGSTPSCPTTVVNDLASASRWCPHHCAFAHREQRHVPLLPRSRSPRSRNVTPTLTDSDSHLRSVAQWQRFRLLPGMLRVRLPPDLPLLVQNTRLTHHDTHHIPGSSSRQDTGL